MNSRKMFLHLASLFFVGLLLALGSSAHAASAVVVAGQPVTLSASVDGSAPFTYQWYKAGVALTGATASTYQIGSFQAGFAGVYSAVISNSAGSTTTDNATLTLSGVPAITTQPASMTVTAGGSVTFTSAASASPAPTLQWKFNGTDITGATGASLPIMNVQSANAGTYTMVATNSAGSVTSAGAILTVTAATIAPVITTQPSSQTVTAGSAVTFSAAATGLPAPTYQWRKDGVNLNGATSAAYTISSTVTSSAGTYTVVAANSAGSVTSNGAVLTVNALVTLTAPSGLTAAASAGAITLGWTDNSTNETGFEVQYSIDGTNFYSDTTVGANVKSYPDASLPDSTTYFYRVRAVAGTVTSAFSNIASATTPVTAPNWVQADIGSVGLAGSGNVSATAITVSASGADIWGTSDAYRFVYQPWSGDGVIVARVASLDYTDVWAKAGVMFRESLAENSRNALAYVTPVQGINFQTRTATAGTSAVSFGPGASAPYWIKLVRAGNTFTAYASANGTTWTLITSQQVTMATNLYVGFAVTSHNNTVRTTAVFDQISLTRF
mgnify:CR=1 FL=1